MSNLNLNKVVLCGRITANPELKSTQIGLSVLSFSLAVNRRFHRDENTGQNIAATDFIQCVAWRQTADFIAKYFKKGDSICVTGAIQTRNWTHSDGSKRYVTEVIIDEANFVDSRSDKNQSDTYVPNVYGNPTFTSPEDGPNFEDVKTDDDLPF